MRQKPSQHSMSTLISERSYDAEVLSLWERGTNLLPLEDVAV